MRFASPLLIIALAAALSGCSSGPDAADPAPRNQRTEGILPSSTDPAGSAPETEESARPLTGTVIAVDPGHNGGNAAHPAEINALVSDGRGGQKACNTVGAETAGGFPEHRFTWEVASLVRTALEALGARTVLSRDDDEGVGPCVDERGAFAGEADADLLLSIHANGTVDPTAQGFHIIIAGPPDGRTQAARQAESRHEDSRQAADSVAAAFRSAGLSSNQAYGADGVVERTDLAGLNHAVVPAVLIECGEMRNPEDAARMESAAGREEYARAIVAGVLDHLAPAGTEPAQVPSAS